MKKWNMLLAAVVLCLALTACGGSGSKQDDDTALEESDFVSKVEESTYSILLTVNPQIKMFVGSDMKVQAVECVNDDAKALFGGQSFVQGGESYEVYLRKILDKLEAAGYLKDGSALNATLYGVGVSGAQMDAISSQTHSVVQAFREDRQITVAFSLGGGVTAQLRPENGLSGSGAGSDQETDFADQPGPGQEVLERNEDGLIIKIKETDSAGNVVVTTFDDQKRTIEVVITQADGSTLTEKKTYYANGNLKTEESYDSQNGSRELWTYSEDGKTRRRETAEAVWTDTFHSGGGVAKSQCQAKPGHKVDDWTYDEYTYDQNGQTLTHYRIRTNGLHMYSTYHSAQAFTMVTKKDGVVIGTEYWVGNTKIGGIDSNGNAYGQTHDTYTGTGSGGTTGVGGE